jgi:hypothetical protein
VTSSVSGRRAPAAPIAQDDVSLPELRSAPAGIRTSRPGTVQVCPGLLQFALDDPERRVSRQAQQPAHALPARRLLVRAAGVVVVGADRLVVLEGLVAHRAGLTLGLQELLEALHGQAVTGEPVGLVPPGSVGRRDQRLAEPTGPPVSQTRVRTCEAETGIEPV